MQTIADTVGERTLRRRALAQGSLVMTSGSQSAVFNPNTKADSFPEGTSKFQVNYNLLSSDLSPRPSSPPSRELKTVGQLDLSDEGSPEVADYKPEVLVTNALSQRLSADTAEVELSETKEKTPVKVVCHTKQAIESALRSDGDTSQAAVIPVDHLSSVAVTGSTESRSPGMYEERNSFEQPRIAGGKLDDRSVCEIVESFSPPHLAKPITPSNKEKRAITFPKDLELDTSNKDVKENINPQPELQMSSLTISKADKIQPEVKLTSEDKPKLRKKKQGRVVASKFMQKASSVKGNKAKSQQESYSSMLDSSRMKSQQRADSMKDRSIALAKESMSLLSSSRTRKQTPVSQTSRMKASTPENFSALPNESFNVSAVNSNRTVSRVLNESESFIAVNHNNNARERVLERSKFAALPKKFSEENVTQNSLDLVYGRYLQWCFLSSKAQKALATEEQEVMSQLHGLWEENRRMKHKLSMLQQEHDRLKHVTNLDEMLDLQKSCLAPIVHDLPQLQQYYQSMALALDTTRHELVTHGIHIPDTAKDRAKYEESMLSALKESQQLLGEIKVQTRQKSADTSQYAQAIEVLSRVITEENEELQRCKELVRAAQTMSNQENSMRIQEIEFSRV